MVGTSDQAKTPLSKGVVKDALESSLLTSKEESSSVDQLSQDLVLFLSNPSLRAALADGSLDLASYSSTVEEELVELETKCIAKYRSKAKEIETMNSDLQECQSVLSSLREMLLGFQADLGSLSGEIRQLQEKSRTLDVQVKNRKEAEKGLRNFLSHIVIAPNMAHAITTGPVNPTFLQAVQELNQIYKDCRDTDKRDWAMGNPPADTTAGIEMQGKVETLRLLAVRRIRDYFLEQISLLRKPQTNVRMIQVHGLLKYSALQDFLQEASPEIASEILNVYLESMSKTLLQLFRTYQAQLLQLDSTKQAATRQDVIAIEDSLLRDSLTTKAKKRVDLVCLGRRAIDCLDEADSRPIMAHVALAEGHRYPYERLFRSILGHLVDAVTNEHVFCRQFFKRDCFTPLFHGTLGLLLEQLENYLFSCYDALCLLLMIKVAHYYRRLTRNRKIHSLDSFFEHCSGLLWPRLKIVMEQHLRSLKQSTAAKLGGVDLQQHYVSRRFAEFCCSILLILHNRPQQHSQTGTASQRRTAVASAASDKASGGSDGALSDRPLAGQTQLTGNEDGPASQKSAGDVLLADLAEMVDEFVMLLERLSEQHTVNKKKIIFLINNLDHVVCIFQERRVVGKEFSRFAELLMKQRELFVEEELLAGFSKMIAFVQQTELHLLKSSGVTPDVNVQVVESLVLDFAQNWKSNIDQINRDVLSYFSNFRNGMEILKQVLTQLLLYYTRFQDIIRKVWRNKPPAFSKHLVSTTVILNEIKKHAMTI
ncbi:hypothetical protein ACA910_022008 [Epithemia clementina (nom. ined.)]